MSLPVIALNGGREGPVCPSTYPLLCAHGEQGTLEAACKGCGCIIAKGVRKFGLRGDRVEEACEHHLCTLGAPVCMPWFHFKRGRCTISVCAPWKSALNPTQLEVPQGSQHCTFISEP